MPKINDKKTPKDLFFEALDKQGIYYPKLCTAKSGDVYIKNFITSKGKVRHIEYDFNGNIIDIY